jgi:hypothetical protein
MLVLIFIVSNTISLDIGAGDKEISDFYDFENVEEKTKK